MLRVGLYLKDTQLISCQSFWLSLDKTGFLQSLSVSSLRIPQTGHNHIPLKSFRSFYYHMLHYITITPDTVLLNILKINHSSISKEKMKQILHTSGADHEYAKWLSYSHNLGILVNLMDSKHTFSIIIV